MENTQIQFLNMSRNFEIIAELIKHLVQLRKQTTETLYDKVHRTNSQMSQMSQMSQF